MVIHRADPYIIFKEYSVGVAVEGSPGYASFTPHVEFVIAKILTRPVGEVGGQFLEMERVEPGYAWRAILKEWKEKVDMLSRYDKKYKPPRRQRF